MFPPSRELSPLTPLSESSALPSDALPSNFDAVEPSVNIQTAFDAQLSVNRHYPGPRGRDRQANQEWTEEAQRHARMASQPCSLDALQEEVRLGHYLCKVKLTHSVYVAALSIRIWEKTDARQVYEGAN